MQDSSKRQPPKEVLCRHAPEDRELVAEGFRLVEERILLYVHGPRGIRGLLQRSVPVRWFCGRVNIHHCQRVIHDHVRGMVLDVSALFGGAFVSCLFFGGRCSSWHRCPISRLMLETSVTRDGQDLTIRDRTHQRWHGRPSSHVIWLRRQ